MKRSLYLLFLLNIGAILPFQAVRAGCLGSDIKMIVVPMDYERKDIGHFQWKVRLVDRDSPHTLVVIPGGPGGTSMQGHLSLYPSEFNLLLIDPRTIGCNNENPVSAAENISTLAQARDLASAVEQLHLKNYFIYGQSYGTQVATVATWLLERKGLPPDAIVLEGAVGTERSFLDGYNRVLTRLLSRLPNSVSDQIRSISEELPLLNFKAKPWAYLILQYLPAGAPDNTQASLLENLINNGLGAQANGLGKAVLESELSAMAKEADSKNDPTLDRFFLDIACRESFPIIADDFTLSNGKITVRPGAHNRCSGYAFDRPYDPHQFQLHTPIWYLQGTEDPSTPLEDALYHFNGQVFTKRTFIEFLGGGHSVSATHQTCMKQVWKNIMGGITQTNRLESVCSSAIKVRIRNAKPLH